jgi:putative ABC transport system permease protein
MFGYYLKLALISIRKHIGMSLLMTAAIALGIGTCMSIVTINYIMSKDPIPAKSDVLYAVQLDGWSPNEPFRDDGSAPDQLTYTDAMALMEAGIAFRQTALVGTSLVIEPEEADAKPFQASGRAAYADFFAMFDVPFLYGAGWTSDADRGAEPVVVLTRAINDRMFGGEDSTGRPIRMNGRMFRVAGVIDHWQPMPRFYDVTTGPFNPVEDLFVPFTVVIRNELPRNGNTNCWKPVEGDGYEAFLASECIWVQFWAELRDRDERTDYLAFLDSYATEQKAMGRFQRPLNNHLRDVNDWLEFMQVVDRNATMMLPVAVMFLAVCLLNTIGLLLAKFLGRAHEIGLRRALGASRRTLFAQYMVESGVIGVAGGLLGLGLTWLGLAGIVRLFGSQVANLAQLDGVMVASAVLLAIIASMLAGIYPTWRACNVMPAAQLR